MRIALWMSLALSCVPTAEDGMLRALSHTMEPGDTLGGDVLVEVWREATGLAEADRAQATLWISAGEPPADAAGWERLWQVDDAVLWRRQVPVAASAVSVSLDDLPGKIADPPEADPLRGWVQHGPVSPGGELVVTAFLQPPARMPRRPCLSLDLQGQRLSLGTLLQGRGGFVPGAGPRPVVRHRARVAVPADLAMGVFDAELVLHQCGSGFAYGPPSSLSIEVSAGGLPTREQLGERLGTADSEAEWAPARGRRYALRRNQDGTIDEVPAPPLPRVERGAAFGLLILPPLQLGPWGPTDGTVGPLTALGPLLDEADAAMVYLTASASMQGVSPDDRPVQRVRPDVLGHLAEVDLQGVILGAAPRSIQGDGTADAAQAFGLQVDRVNVGDNDNAVGVVFVVGEGDRVPSREGVPEDALVFGVIEGPVDDPVAAARALAEAGFDAGWVGDDALGPVVIHEGVAVLAGLPPMQPVGTSLAMRWYVNPEGVLRLDLVGMTGKGGRWSRVRDDAVKVQLERASAESAALDVRLAVGQQVAGVEITHHGRRERVPARPLELAPLEPAALPPFVLPEQCRYTADDASPGDQPIAVGEDLMLHRARLIDDQAGPDDPVRVELVWEAKAALPPGRMQWYVAGHPGVWRDSTSPCEGLWPFQDFVPGTLVQETVRLFPPGGLPEGTGTLQLGLRLGETRPTLGGSRFLDLGQVRVEGPPPPPPPAPPEAPDVPQPETP